MKKLLVVARLITLLLVVPFSSYSQNNWQEREKVKALPLQETNRPLRTLHSLTLTVGQTEGDLIGKDDKIIQAGIEYLDRLGGGTLCILPGVYNIRNSIFLHPNITLKGSGENTVLKMSPGFVTPIIRDCSGREYGVEVKDASGFITGGGIMLRTTAKAEYAIRTLIATITRIDGDIIYFDRYNDTPFYVENKCTAATIFPILTAEHVDNVVIEDIVLDGDREQNTHINGNFSGALFTHYCNKWNFKNVIARNYNGDGFSWQTSDDFHFENCKALNNADLGFHPGGSAQRPVVINCTGNGNSQGMYFCWGVTDGLVENCTFSGNVKYGISIGHRDTDNLIQNCLVENNQEIGIYFRKDEEGEFFGGNRNLIRNCTVKDNGSTKEGVGIDITWKTKDITIENTKFISSQPGKQKIGIQIGKDADRIKTTGNTFDKMDVEIKNLKSM
jgi:parallel beta-helix repeat protein